MSFYAEYPPQGGSGGGVTSLDTLTGAVTLVAGSDITIIDDGGANTITIASTGANTTLSNLDDPTALNQILIFDPNTIVDGAVVTGDITGGDDSGQLTLQSGGTEDGNSGDVFVSTGSQSGTGNSGRIILSSGDPGDGASGSVQLATGSPSGAGNSGNMTLHTGGSPSNSTGTIQIFSGGVTSGAAASGGISLFSGNAVDGNSGGAQLSSGGVTGIGASGTITLSSGASVDGNSGDINIVTATPSGAGSQGAIRLINGSEGTPGDIWTATGTDGEGAWQTLSGSGANTTLSNLTSPTAINQSLLPSASNTWNLGSANSLWLTLFINNISIRSGATDVGTINLDSTPSGSATGFAYSGGNAAENLVFFTQQALGGTASIWSETGFAASTTAGATGSINQTTGAQQNASSTGATGSLNLTTGANAGTGSSGNIVLTSGTGSTRGTIVLKNGSEGVAGQVWTSTDTTGKGAWAAVSAIPSETALGTVTWAAGVAPSGTVSKTYRSITNGKQITILAKITATIAGTAVTSVSFPLPAGLPVPATWGTQESGGLISPGTGSIATAVSGAVSGSSGLYDDGAGGYVIKIFDTAAINATDAYCSVTYIS